MRVIFILLFHKKLSEQNLLTFLIANFVSGAAEKVSNYDSSDDEAA